MKALSIAGFDPSGGAGITSDIKTFEAHGVYGLGVCTGVTIQNDVNFKYVSWIDKSIIIQQINILFERFTIDYIKIGLAENIETILHTIQHVKQLNPNVYIVWDPILKASAGFDFQHQISPNTLRLICENIYLITPNIEEFDLIFDRDLPQNIVKKYGCNVLLKGGHAKGQVVVDTLFTHQNKCLSVSSTAMIVYSAITITLLLRKQSHDKQKY